MKKLRYTPYILVFLLSSINLFGQTVVTDWKTKDPSIELITYVDSLIYDVLMYDPSKVALTPHREMITEASTTAKITIRDASEVNPLPLIILNGLVVEDKTILKKFILSEAQEISYLGADKASVLYGARAINGVIIITVAKRKFKKVWREFGK